MEKEVLFENTQTLRKEKKSLVEEERSWCECEEREGEKLKVQYIHTHEPHKREKKTPQGHTLQ